MTRLGGAAAGHRYLLITSYYSGLRAFVEGRAAEPAGMPAIAELWRGLSQAGIDFDHLLFDARQQNSPVIEERRLPGLNGRVIVKRSAVGPFNRVIGMFTRLGHVIGQARRGEYDLIYIDRANLIEGAGLRFFVRTPIVLRLHGAADLPEKLSRPGLHLVKWARRFAMRSRFAHIIASQDGSPVQQFLERYAHPEVARKVWLSGVPREQNEPLAEPAARPLNILFLSRLAGDKGVELFVDALRQLSQQRADYQVRIAGDGPLVDVLRARTADLERVELLGSVQRSAVQKLYREADVFVSLNQYGNLNNTVLEALNAGCCILTYDASVESGRDMATRELLGNAVYYIAPDSDSAAVAAHLQRLLDAPAEVAKYRERARVTGARLLRSWPERIAEEVALLESLID